MGLPPRSSILWGTNYENILTPSYPLDEVTFGRVPRDGSEWAQAPSGVEEASLVGHDYTLEAVAQWISRAEWAGPLGVQAFLDWARDKNTFRFVPDYAVPSFYADGCYLAGSMRDIPQPAVDGSLAVPLVIRNPSVDLGMVFSGLMFHYAAGGSITDPTAATFARATAATYRGVPGGLYAGVGASAASGVLRDRHYESSLRTALLEPARTQLVTEPEDFSTWTAGGTPGVTGGQADPFGGTAAYLLEDDDAGTAESVTTVVGFTGDASKALPLFVKAGTAAATTIRINDSTAGVIRVQIQIAWSGGVPSPSINGGAGTIFATEHWGGGWYRILFAGDSIVAANTNQLIVYPSSSTSSATGTVYVFGANAWDAAVPSSYQGPSLDTRNADAFSWPWPYAAQAMFLYVKYVERGSGSLSDQRIWTLGASASTAPYFALQVGTNDRVLHNPGAGAVNSAFTPGAFGATHEVLAILYPDGSVKSVTALDGGSEVAGTPSAAAAFTASAWAGGPPKLFLNEGNGTTAGLAAIASVKAGPLTYAGVTRDTIAKAVAA